jgi:ubiquinone/menaquinone biosynthesis C-methylase UbiE
MSELTGSPPITLALCLQRRDGREDLVLRLGEWQHVCETHYLSLDRGVEGDVHNEKLRASLTRLLEQWRAAVAALRDGAVVYLPFDFADQSTAWLRVRRTGEDVCVDAGWSAVEGWSFFPSNIAAHVQTLADFQPLCEVEGVQVGKNDFLRMIDASLDLARLLPLPRPAIDPTPIFEHFRGSYGTELLTAAVAHFDLFGLLARQPLPFAELRIRLGLEARPLRVLTTALRAMRLLTVDGHGRCTLTPLAEEHLIPGGPFDVGDYIGLAATSPGVLEMVERLRTNRPAGGDGGGGTAFIYRAGTKSAMDHDQLARHFTLALAGRAANVAPHLARVVDLANSRQLLDVAGGTGLYSLAFLQQFPQLSATVLDRPEVLKVAAEYRVRHGMQLRLALREGDMFADEWPACDVVLLSNVLHDWDVPTCRELVSKAAALLPPGGQIIIHDVFLNDALDGPLPIALYSAALFTLTEGRAYSAAEYREWLAEAGFEVSLMRPTLVHCGALVGTKL